MHDEYLPRLEHTSRVTQLRKLIPVRPSNLDSAASYAPAAVFASHPYLIGPYQQLPGPLDHFLWLHPKPPTPSVSVSNPLWALKTLGIAQLPTFATLNGTETKS